MKYEIWLVKIIIIIIKFNSLNFWNWNIYWILFRVIFGSDNLLLDFDRIQYFELFSVKFSIRVIFRLDQFRFRINTRFFNSNIVSIYFGPVFRIWTNAPGSVSCVQVSGPDYPLILISIFFKQISIYLKFSNFPWNTLKSLKKEENKQ